MNLRDLLMQGVRQEPFTLDPAQGFDYNQPDVPVVDATGNPGAEFLNAFVNAPRNLSTQADTVQSQADQRYMDAMSQPAPTGRKVAFRTPDLIGLLFAALAGDQGGDFIRGYLGAKQSSADRATQEDALKYERQRQQAQMRYQMDTQGANRKYKQAQSVQDLQQAAAELRQKQLDAEADRSNKLDLARIAAMSRENVAGIGADAKRDANRVAQFKALLGAASPEGRGLLAREYNQDPDFAEAMAGMTPKEKLAKAQTGQVNANTALTQEKTKDLQTFRPYKVQEFIQKGDLRSAETEYKKASTDHMKTMTRLAPAQAQARIRQMDANTRKALGVIGKAEKDDMVGRRATTKFLRDLDKSIGDLRAQEKYYQHIINTAPGKINDPNTDEKVRETLQRALMEAENGIVFVQAKKDAAMNLKLKNSPQPTPRPGEIGPARPEIVNSMFGPIGVREGGR